VLNAVAIKPQRPFKAVTAGDDCSVVFYNGVPFKVSSFCCRPASSHCD
jgi:hypothetical protein